LELDLHFPVSYLVKL